MTTKKRKSAAVKSEESPPYDHSKECGDHVIQRALEVLEGRLRKPESEITVTDPKQAGNYFKLKLAERDREVFAVLFLDTRHQMLTYEELFLGTIDGAEVHPRVVVKRALELNAGAVILAHNHPSGNTEPSAADRAVTAQLKQALSVVDVRLLDHFVVGRGEPVSMAMRGWV